MALAPQRRGDVTAPAAEVFAFLEEVSDKERAAMKIGFYMGWNKNNSKGDVIGDELLAEALCRELRKDESVESAELYAPNFPVRCSLDVMIYLEDNVPPTRQWARKHVL